MLRGLKRIFTVHHRHRHRDGQRRAAAACSGRGSVCSRPATSATVCRRLQTPSRRWALLAYRFQDGALRGQTFGNLFLAALNGMCDTFDEAVARMSEVLAITGRVLPVTNENVQLLADFDDGVTVTGESQIAE